MVSTMMNKKVYALYLGLKNLLAKFSSYELDFRAKMLFSSLILLDIFWITVIVIQLFGLSSPLGVNNYVRYGVIAACMFAIYLYISALEKKFSEKQSIDIRMCKTYALTWICLTFFVLIPIGVYTLF